MYIGIVRLNRFRDKKIGHDDSIVYIENSRESEEKLFTFLDVKK